MPSPGPSSPSSVLRHPVRRAARLAYCFARFQERVEPDDAGYAWAVARAEQLRRVVAGVVSEQQQGWLVERQAAAQLHSYVQELEESLLAYARSRRRASSPPGRERQAATERMLTGACTPPSP